eukprot:12834101-Alexandrium_andersonii.AAC.1
MGTAGLHRLPCQSMAIGSTPRCKKALDRPACPKMTSTQRGLGRTWAAGSAAARWIRSSQSLLR